MATVNREFKKLENDLFVMLAPSFPGLNVTIAPSRRWNRMSAEFCWPGFTELLPEERFQRLCAVIPERFRADRMAGFVWLELAPDETVEDFLKLPRSEDLSGRKKAVGAELVRIGFFDALADGCSPDRCGGDFTQSMALLKENNLSAAKVRDSKLLFIQHGAFCDCQVVATVRGVLEENFAQVVQSA